MLGVVAYGLWGLFPIYFALLDDVSPIQVVADRVVWSLLFLAILTTITRNWARSWAAARNTRTVVMLGIAACFLAVNWGTYVYAVSTDQVVQASLGYFLNPLVSVGLGMVFLRERLRGLQWAAVGMAAIAVAILTVSYGTIPWIALILAVSFGIYGLLKKQAGADAVESLTIETAVLAPLAIVIIAWGILHGSSGYTSEGFDTVLLLILLGPVTAIPLLLFGGAAVRIPLSTLGLLQYITPVFQFLLGVFYFDETMTATRWVGFFVVWLCLVLVTVDALRQARRGRTATLERELVEPD